MPAHFERAQLLLEQHRPEMAEKEFRAALAEDPDHAEAHALLGLCLCQQKKYEEATGEARRAVALAPDAPFGHYALAVILSDRHHIREAAASAQEALRLAPDAPDFWGLLAGIRLEEKRWLDALEAAENGLRHDAEHERCLNIRAIALVKLGRQKEADATIEVALRQNPDNALTHANQGWALLQQSKPKEAMGHFREALRLDPENDWARHGIVEALKARHLVYRWMLRYFLFMSRLSDKAAWLVVLGLWLGNVLIRRIGKAHPEWQAYLDPVLYVYLGFCLLTVLSIPLFNLLLRLNRFGRLALSKEQIAGSNWLGLILLGLIVSLGGYFASAHPVHQEMWLISALGFGLLTIPFAGIYLVDAGYPRWLMAGIAAVLFGVFAASMSILLVQAPKAYQGIFDGLMLTWIWGCVLSTWAINILGNVRVKK